MSEHRLGDRHPIVYVESEAEQRAWLTATFGEAGQWTVLSETAHFDGAGRQHEVLDIALASGDRVRVPFADAAPEESIAGGRDRTREMDDVMERASGYAEANPPHHPGSLPRFPVPSATYHGAVAIPMPVLAIDGGVRGLYAPPRQVIIRRDDLSLVGVGEYPGFDPEHWPPTRLGDWPPAQLRGMPAGQLQATIARFSACWSRVLDAWFAGVAVPAPVLVVDIKEALHRRTMLDLMSFLPFYDRLNPAFAEWLTRMVAARAAQSGAGM